jgi:hypothetical protein
MLATSSHASQGILDPPDNCGCGPEVSHRPFHRSLTVLTASPLIRPAGGEAQPRNKSKLVPASDGGMHLVLFLFVLYRTGIKIKKWKKWKIMEKE